MKKIGKKKIQVTFLRMAKNGEWLFDREARKPKTVIMNEVEPRVVKTVKRMRKVMKKRVKIVKKMVKKVKKKVVEEKDAEDEEEAAPTSKSYKNRTKHPIPLRAKPKLNAKKTGKQVEAGEVVECELKVRLLPFI